MSATADPPNSRASPSRVWGNPWLLLALACGAFVVLKLSGAGELLRLERLREWVAFAGPAGPVLFFAMFVLGVVLQVPGMVFVLAAPALFSLPVALAVVLLGANVAANTSFVLVRRLGGQSLRGDSGPAFVRRAFAQLAARPIRSVTIIRLAVLLLPPVTAALALTKLRLRDHALGTALAVTPILAAIVLFEVLTLE